MDSKKLIDNMLKVVIHKHPCIDLFCVMLKGATSPWVLKSVVLVFLKDIGPGEHRHPWLFSGGGMALAV